MVKFSIFFRYLTLKEKVLMWIGAFSAIACGALLPAIAIVIGEVTDTFDPDNSPDDILDTMKMLAVYITIVGLGTWLFGYVFFAFWQHLAENISFNLRMRYLNQILRQDITYFELQNVE